MKKYILYGKNFTTKKDTYKYLKDTLELSDDFGNNLDALWDELTMKNDVQVSIENARCIPKNLGEYGLKILDVFGDLNREYYKIDIFW